MNQPRVEDSSSDVSATKGKGLECAWTAEGQIKGATKAPSNLGIWDNGRQLVHPGALVLTQGESRVNTS